MFASPCVCFPFFFFNDTATTEIYTLSLHDALPISIRRVAGRHPRGRHVPLVVSPLGRLPGVPAAAAADPRSSDRKSTRLNSSHGYISYAVFCLKKKKTPTRSTHARRRNETRMRSPG